MNREDCRATKIMIIRHAEKPSDGLTKGVNEHGKSKKDSLTVRGWQRAGALAGFFAPPEGVFQNSSIETPQFLFASTPKKEKGSHRSFETIWPLSLKLEIEINTDYRRKDYREMIDEVYRCHGTVLICWQKEYIPKIANLILGREDLSPQRWSELRFDVVWVFERNAQNGEFEFKQVPQKLLAGDKPSPIKF